MQEAWIQLRCPSCGITREANPAKLPAPDDLYACDGCEAAASTSEFTRTARDFEVLAEFHDA